MFNKDCENEEEKKTCILNNHDPFVHGEGYCCKDKNSCNKETKG